MITSRKKTLLGLSVALIATLILVGTVYADDGGGETPASGIDVFDAAAPADTIETPVPAQSDTTDEAVTEIPQIDPTTEIETVSTDVTIADALQETGVTLTDENGSDLLAGNGTNSILAAGDPYYTVGTTKYAFVSSASDCPIGTSVSSGTCTVSSTPIQAAIDSISSNGLPSDRKIYVLAGTYSGDVSIDGTSYTALKGLTGLIGENSDNTIISGNVSVTGGNAGFTLSGFTVNGSVVFDGNSGTVTLKDLTVTSGSDDGIKITRQQGAVVMDSVTSDNNYGDGGTIQNNSSSTAYAVTITNSEFDGNSSSNQEGWGLYVATRGAVTMNGVSASNNVGTGLLIVGSGGSTAVSLKNSFFSSNTSDKWANSNGIGLYIFASGNLTMDTVEANDNSSTGISITSTYPDTIKNVTASNNTYGSGMVVNGSWQEVGYMPNAVTIYNGVFDNNGGTGLVVASGKNILASFITANNNDGNGVVLDNCLDAGDIGVCTGNGTITVLNPSLTEMTFSGNYYDGLEVISSGSIILNGIGASENGYDGLYVANDFIGKSGSVTINVFPGDFTTESSNFTLNGWNGIYILTNGAVTINGLASNYVYADGNGRSGLLICEEGLCTAQAVTVKYLYSQDNDNLTDGDSSGAFPNIQIISKANISLTAVFVNDKTGAYATDGDGIVLDNTAGSGSILINGSYSYDNGGYGYSILTYGTVAMGNVQAVGNGADGVYIDNCGYNSILATCKGKSGVTFLGTDNVFAGNTGNGLNIVSVGAITLNNTFAGSNDESGINIELPVLAIKTSGAIKIINTNTAFLTSSLASYGNGADALYIRTYGAVTVQGFYNNSAGNFGLYIDNSSALSAQPVILKDVTIYNAGNDGIEIFSKGVITVTGTTSSCNAGDGLYINNSYTAANVIVSSTSYTSGGVTKYTVNTFEYNSGQGLYIVTNGVVSLINVAANDNTYDGILVDDAGVSKAITLGGITTNDNGLAGVDIVSLGSVSWLNGESHGNGGHGVSIDNRGLLTNVVALASINVSLSDGNGFDIQSTGPVGLRDVTSMGNVGDGVNIDNTFLSTAAPIVMVTNGRFDYNQNGLIVYSNGVITVQGVEAENNFYRATNIGTLTTIHTIYSALGTGNAVDCTSTSCTTENAYALWAFTLTGSKTITVSVAADFAGTLTLYNSNDTAVKSITFTGDVTKVSFSSSLAAGFFYVKVYANSGDYGAYNLTLNNGMSYTSNQYYGYGVYLRNDTGSGNVTVTKGTTQTQNEFAGNGGEGLFVFTNGAIAVSSTNSEANVGSNMDLRNFSSLIYAPVTIVGGVYDDSLSADGLGIYSTGNVTLTNVSASGNGQFGLYVDNNMSGSGKGTITLNSSTGSAFVGNGNDGVYLESNNAIKLNAAKYISSVENGGAGFELINNGDGITAGITLTGVFNSSSSYGTITAEDNDKEGFNIQSNGVVAATYLLAYDNGLDGINVGDYDATTLSSSVIILNSKSLGSCSSEEDLGSNGINIYAAGPVVIINVLSEYTHNGDGIFIDTTSTITIKKISANNNRYNGISLYSDGNIFADSILANNNYSGMFVHTTGGSFTLNSSYFTNEFNNSVGNEGLIVFSVGFTTLNNFTSSNNKGYAAIFYSTGTLTINGATTMNNASGGIYAEVYVGNATINSLVSLGNGNSTSNGHGLYLHMTDGDITIKNSAFMKNYGNGIYILSDALEFPTITITGTVNFCNDVDKSGDGNLAEYL